MLPGAPMNMIIVFWAFVTDMGWRSDRETEVIRVGECC